MRIALALLDFCLLLSPREFRRAYRDSISADLRDLVDEEFHRHGLAGAVWCALHIVADVCAGGIAERAMMFGRDLVFALRSLRKTPFFTAVVIVTFAVAIAANAAAFSVVDAVLLKPLPYDDPQALVALSETLNGQPDGSFSYPNFRDLRAQNHSFIEVAAAAKDGETMTGRGRPEALEGQSVSAAYFDVLRAQPELGRLFEPADARPGAPRVVVLSDALYRSKFGADPAILASAINLNGLSYRIIGVLPRSFREPGAFGPQQPDYFTALVPTPENGAEQRGAIFLRVFARLRPGVTLDRASADVHTVMANLARRYVETNKHIGAHVVSLTETIVGNVRPLLAGIFAAVAGLLFVACANVANLLLSRAATREREFAVRSAVGASRGRIMAQILTETLLFAVAGGVAGVILAALAVREFVALQPPGIPRLDAVTFDGGAALFTFAAVVLCALLAGIVPAVTLSRTQLTDALAAAGRGADRNRGARARAAFVVAQIAITLALVVASGLVVRSFIALTQTPLGFDPAGVLTVRVSSLPEHRYGHSAALIAFEQRAVARIAALPGAIDAAWAATVPFDHHGFRVTFAIPHRPLPAGDTRDADFNIVSAGYFRVLHIPLVRGRLFAATDRTGTTPVVIVNEAFVRTYYHGASPIGSTLEPGLSDESGPRAWTIVGICADSRETYAAQPRPAMYFPATQIAFTNDGTVIVRSQPGIDRAALAAAIPAIDPDLAAGAVGTLETLLVADAERARISALGLGILAALALMLAGAGIYAVVSYSVAQRTHEIGIRKALGARGFHVMRDVLARAARLAALGILAGLILAALGARVVETQLYGVGVSDPLTYAAVVLSLFAATLIAALVPALRAMRVDPVVALRYE